MPRNKRIRWGALLGIVALGLLLPTAPGQAQMSCDWCRWVPCPDAPSTVCLDPSFNETTCYNWGICFPVEYFRVASPVQTSRVPSATGPAALLRALQCPASLSTPERAAQPGRF